METTERPPLPRWLVGKHVSCLDDSDLKKTYQELRFVLRYGDQYYWEDCLINAIRVQVNPEGIITDMADC